MIEKDEAVSKFIVLTQPHFFISNIFFNYLNYENYEKENFFVVGAMLLFGAQVSTLSV